MTTSMSASSLHCSGPGSPYRTSSGSLNGLSTRPSLNKELVQKLRSMTETIKLLSDENVFFREENQRLQSLARNIDVDVEDYDSLSKSELAAVVASYDQKIRTLSNELQKVRIDQQQQQHPDQQSNNNKVPGEKDKYKSLARRLKEERNNYKAALEEKQNEHTVLKDEMEKMSDLISGLRENCQKLRSELTEVRSRRSSSEGFVDIGVQTTPERKFRTGFASETARRARSVYAIGSKTQSVTKSNSTPPPSSSSSRCLRSSPASKTTVTNKTNKTGPKIAKPVQKPPSVTQESARSSSSSSSSASSSSSSLSSPSLISSTTTTTTTKRTPIASKIPLSSRSPVSRIPGSRIPMPASPSPCRSSGLPLSRTKSSIPSPIHKQRKEKKKKEQEEEEEERKELKKLPSSLLPSPSHHQDSSSSSSSSSDGDYVAHPAIIADHSEELEEEILVIQRNQDGKFELSFNKNSKQFKQEAKNNEETDKQKIQRRSIEHDIDDDDDDDDDDEDDEESSVIDSVPCTPIMNKKRLEKSSIAARRVHRTWQHFYEELEGRNNNNNDSPILGSQTIRKFSKENDETKNEITDSKSKSIHTARPWLKSNSTIVSNKTSAFLESSEDDENCINNKALDIKRLQADKDLFTTGKVSAIKAQFNERRRQNPERSDGITDEEDDS